MDPPGQQREELADTLTGDEPARQDGSAATDRQSEQEAIHFGFPFQGQVLPQSIVVEQLIPVGIAGDLKHQIWRVPGRVKGPEDAPHARAGDHVELQADLGQHADDADVSEPSCRTAAEHQAELGSRLWRHLRAVLLLDLTSPRQGGSSARGRG